jgi:phytoene dehydrogenase-like protein
VRLADGTAVEAGAVLIAAGPHEAAELVPGASGAALRQWAAEALPITAACLDLGLRRLPRPAVGVAFGIDQPLYFSVHSVNARLAPEGCALAHVAKYQGPGPSDPEAELAELEAWMDLLQPGWREVVVERRFLPRMTVSNAVVTATAGGPSGRPGPEVPGLPGLYVAGDWVGPAGMLADASLASARLASERILDAVPSEALALTH